MELLPARVPLNYASLFSGIGGFDIGFDRAGMRCVAQAEWDQAASEVLKHHWPNVTHLKDVRDVTRDSFRSIDVLCGGFPCQDVSVAGKRAGLDGERSGLWFEFYRIIKEHTPRWVVIENVPGLLTSNRGRDFAVIIDGLVKCGYRVAWRVLDAQYFGLAQRRKRVFIVASFGDGRCAEVLFEREGSTGDIEPRRAQGQSVATDAPGRINSYRFQSFGEYADTDHASALKARDSKDATDLVAYNITFCDANGRRQDRPNGGLYVNETEHSSTLTQGGIDHTAIVQAIDTRNSRSNGDISGTLQAKKSGGYSLNYTNPIAFSNRGTDTGEVGETLRAGSHGALPMTTTAFGVRRLTPTECERLQGFPDGHTAVNGQSDSKRYKQLGNAVAVPVAEWIARRIVAADNAQPA